MNRIVSYSRATHFILLCSLALILNAALESGDIGGISSFYGIQVDTEIVVSFWIQVFCITLLCFPLIFAAGLLPQINTFFNYVLEQTIIHGFGGTGTIGPLEALFEFFKAAGGLGVLICVAFLVTRLSSFDPTQPSWYSLFCGLVLGIGYLVSSWEGIYPAHIPTPSIINRKAVAEEAEPLLMARVSRTNILFDLVLALAMTAYGTALQASTICSYKDLLFAVAGVAVALGIFLRSILLELKKPFPFRLLRHPTVVCIEHDMFEVHSTFFFFRFFFHSRRKLKPSLSLAQKN